MDSGPRRADCLYTQDKGTLRRLASSCGVKMSCGSTGERGRTASLGLAAI
jgi:hypothetical protein